MAFAILAFLHFQSRFSKPVAKLDAAESVQPPSAVFTSSTKQPLVIVELVYDIKW